MKYIGVFPRAPQQTTMEAGPKAQAPGKVSLSSSPLGSPQQLVPQFAKANQMKHKALKHLLTLRIKSKKHDEQHIFYATEKLSLMCLMKCE